jgi:hypothetical protein
MACDSFVRVDLVRVDFDIAMGFYCPARMGDTISGPPARFLPSPLSCW